MPLFQLILDWKAIVKALHGIEDAITKGFDKVAEAISKLQPPEPPPDDNTAVRGDIMGRYKFSEDQAPIDYTVTAGNFKSAKNKPVSAQGIKLAIQSSSPNLVATMGEQTVSEDGNSVSASVHLEGNPDGMDNVELAVVTTTATNEDTGNQIAADVDEFETGPGEPVIGTIDSPVPLPEVGA